MNKRLKKIKEILFKIPQKIASHAFFTCLILLLISLSVGFIVFLKCNSLIQKVDLEGLENLNVLNYQKYNQVLEKWKKDEERFEAVDSKNYLNPFIQQEELTEGEI